ncbi:2-C-methyl-D-erythritol 4-phosphate cytidylyltransferase [Candidatus Ruminimicrobium bovinum]|uniref:2-C-methyl-D-erythritol 4-phosphate cytidylyltransferase n=1 Tax=Candidatus Ruminimicrobium bovinum TaxID=3242779 RepID=UPI0039B9696D
MNKLKNYGIILASGTGSRYGADIPKQFIKIAGKTILEHTIEIFEKSSNIDEIIIVITPEYRLKAEDILLKNNYKKVSKILNGGETRKESSYIGISSIDDEEANIVIHDCARPFLTQRIIDDCIKALEKYDAIDVAIPSADTIIKIKDNIIENIPNRAVLRRGQTPQCFKLSLIKKAHELSKNDKNFTDDCGLIVKYNLGEVYVVEGDTENIKVTYPSDIFMADKLFQIRSNLYPSNIGLEKLKDKVIVIFGGTSGIGEATANLAKEYKAKIYTPSLRNDCDITNYNQIEKYLKKVFEENKKIDYVINSAGILSMGKLVERKIEDIQKDININYIGSINVVKAAIPYIKQSKGSMQLYASSSYTRGRALYSTYSSTKAGIVNLVQALAEELYTEDIRINVINPERTATPMRFKAFGKEPEGSLLQPEKVAEASLKTLLSDLTGQVIDVKRD